MTKLLTTPKDVIHGSSFSALLCWMSVCICVFRPVHVTLCFVCLQRSGRWRGVRTWLTLHVGQLLWSQILGKQTTQSAYMLSALGATGSPHAHGAFCLICCFDVCIKIISTLGVCVMGELKAMQKKYLRGRVCWMALTSPIPNRNIFLDTPLFLNKNVACTLYGAIRNSKGNQIFEK